MSAQEVTVVISIIGILAVAINVYVGLRLAAMQAKLEANAATLKASLTREFAAWKDEVLTAINGKYVSEKLILEIRSGIGREMATLVTRLDHIDERCERRHAHCAVSTIESQD